MYEGVYFCACSESEQVGEVQDFEFRHERSGVGSWWEVFDDSNQLFLYPDEGLYVCFLGVGCTPDGDVADEVWVCMCVVEFSECVCWEESGCEFEGVYNWPQLLDDIIDGPMVFEVVLYGDTQEGGVGVLFEGGVLDCELDRFWFPREEDGVVGLGWVRG